MSDSPSNKENTVLNVIVAILLVLFVGFVIWFFLKDNDSTGDSETKSYKYGYTMVNYSAIDPATLQFSMELTNQTDVVWEKPSCTVTFESPTGQYRGWDIFTLKEPLSAQSSRTFTGNITVSNEGAQYITKHSVDCE